MKQKRTNQSKRHSTTLANFAAAMESIAPTGLAQEWDNLGVLAGDLNARVGRILLCIDLTHAVVDEAIDGKFDAIMAYHPPIFKPFKSLKMPSHGTESIVYRCVRQGIAIYSTHTALDAADGGTNDALANLAGVEKTEPLEYVDQPGVSELKLITFVPEEALDSVSNALFASGAGNIGDYSHCSYQLRGQGTFLGGQSTNPVVGQRGKLEKVDEVRLEVVIPAKKLPEVVAALRSTHPYEEPAFDIYPLRSKPVRGIGRVGKLPKPVALSKLAQLLKKKSGATCVQLVGDPQREITRIIAVAGAAGDLPFKMKLEKTDCIITGEMRHHDALTIQRRDCTAIALGHWASERPALSLLADKLRDKLAGVEYQLSASDRDPFEPILNR